MQGCQAGIACVLKPCWPQVHALEDILDHLRDMAMEEKTRRLAAMRKMHHIMSFSVTPRSP